MKDYITYARIKAMEEAFEKRRSATDSAAKKPRLSLVTPDFTPIETGKPKMKTPPAPAASKAKTETAASEPAPAVEPARTGPERRKVARLGALHDMEPAISRLSLASDAMLCVGLMMRPGSSAANEQMNMTCRGDMSALFEFFGEAMREQVNIAADAAALIELAMLEENA